MGTFAERDRLTAELELLALWFAERYSRRGLEFDDAKQEAMTAVWIAAGKYRPTGRDCDVPFSAFARKFIVRALERARKKARCRGITQASAGQVSFAAIDLDQALAIEGAAKTGALADAVRDALASLDAKSQLMVLRRYGLDGMPLWSVLECANEFRCTVACVKKVLVRARQVIGAELHAAGWDPARWGRPAAEETAIKVG